MSQDKREVINIVGAALRGLTSPVKQLGILSFDDSKQALAAKGQADLELTLPLKASAEEIISALKEKLPKKTHLIPKSIFVENLGLFRREDKLVSGLTGRVAGKICVVTGAAQGFGLAIAQDLIKQGAFVVLADINDREAISQANALCEQFGKGRAIGLAIDVANARSVSQAAHQVVRKFGGVDVLIPNAGVGKAESVKTQPEKDFDFINSINYKGYFLCVQYFARIMAVQHLVRPEMYSDIIQINSKSGLAGSNRYAAYAGSKFGGIGLTQSFALELIEDGIKVNAICPGNFLDGPLWSDPEKGLFVQFLRMGKVPGAKTIDDVRKAYEAKVPMGRGCKPADVVKAIYYLIEQEYETGQALPVTGGQIMLS